MTELAEKKIRDFCAHRHLKCEWQDMKNLGERAVVKTLDRGLHAQILKAACRIKELRVIDWICEEGGGFRGAIFFHDASAVVRITQAEYDAIWSDFKGVWHNYYGDTPEWEGRRTAMIAEYGTRLLIEGVSLEIT